MPGTLTVDVIVTEEDRRRAMEADVLAGLSGRPRSIPPVWFYDERGSRLFDEITRLPEYYPTRAERAILERRSADIAAASGADTLVEIGSGTSEKTRLLLDAMSHTGQLRTIVLLDISEEVLREAAEQLTDRYGVEVRAVVGDLRSDLAHLAGGRRSLWAFLGSTIGNFPPAERRDLLAQFRGAMAPDDRLLLGTDLIKDRSRLQAAYDDAQGVTAAFNLNVLSVLNAELGADFDPTLYRHRACWSEDEGWIEMRLRSTRSHTVSVPRLDLAIDVEDGEEILTEISAKFDPGRLHDEMARTGLPIQESWTDPPGDFQLSLAAPA